MRRLPLLLAALLAAPLLAEAQQPSQNVSYRCTGKDGKRYYGQTLPPQCAGMPVEVLSAAGTVIRRIDPQADAEKKVLKEAEEAKKRRENAAIKEQTRRDRALLATYTGEGDIESARKRALEDNEKAVREVEARIAALKKRQADLAKESEFYKGRNKPPANFEQDVKNAEIDLRAQQSLLDTKKKEVDTINAKYDEDKRRYLELTGKAPAKK
jgi:uncharacterized metal-binding protein YceD (DUF177 family)